MKWWGTCPCIQKFGLWTAQQVCSNARSPVLLFLQNNKCQFIFVWYRYVKFEFRHKQTETWTICSGCSICLRCYTSSQSNHYPLCSKMGVQCNIPVSISITILVKCVLYESSCTDRWRRSRVCTVSVRNSPYARIQKVKCDAVHISWHLAII